MNILLITTWRVCGLLMCSVWDVATLSLSSVIASTPGVSTPVCIIVTCALGSCTSFNWFQCFRFFFFLSFFFFCCFVFLFSHSLSRLAAIGLLSYT